MAPGWFGPKTHGWGIGPRSAGGWATVFLFVAAAGWIGAHREFPPVTRLWLIGGATALLLLVMALTYERDSAD